MYINSSFKKIKNNFANIPKQKRKRNNKYCDKYVQKKKIFFEIIKKKSVLLQTEFKEYFLVNTNNITLHFLFSN